MSTSNHQILEFTQIRPPLVMMEKTVKWKPNKTELAPNCPRCSSSNTKFCYYNNYSVSQPRYFCKSCRRYWTKGGSLRNVPVGGSCRKTRRGRAPRPPPSKNGGVFASSDDVRMQEGGESVTGDQFGHVRGCTDRQDFVYQGLDGFEVEGMFGGGELWTEGMDLQSYGSQPGLMEVQEFEVFTSDDQLRMSENLVGTDSWGSFDLSGYEDF